MKRLCCDDGSEIEGQVTADRQKGNGTHATAVKQEGKIKAQLMLK